MAALLKILFVLGFFVLGLVPLLVLLERRISAWIQSRIGPNRVGPAGVLQPLADLIKFLFKEDILPAGADRFLYVCGPLLVLVPPSLGLAVIPFGNRIGDEPLQVADLGVGILFTMSVLSVAVYGLAFGGWASNSKYSLLGGLRASAQLISYELALALSIVTAVMLSESIDPQVIVRRQVENGWNVFGGGNLWLLPSGILAFALFFVSALAENNRLPFDLPECEAELVGGYHTEYSAIKFALFMMGEYVGMVLMSALLVTFFLGGWHLPGVTDPRANSWAAGALSVAVFVAKMMAILTLYILIRWTLPRFKYNQLMNLGWKVLVPVSLANVMLVAAIGVWTGGRP
jgi:NADH-quinone oxidoreductase subunit H